MTRRLYGNMGNIQAWRSKHFNFRGLNASISVLFFFNTPKISRGFHFFAIECPKIKSKGRTARTTAVVCFSGTTFSLNQSPAGRTGTFIHPAGGEGIIMTCFAQNLVCIRPVAC